MKRVDTLETELLSDPVELTENALASEFTRRYLEDLRYVHEWGKWLRWDGGRWSPERTLQVYDFARALVRQLGGRVEDRKIGAQLERAATVHAIVSLARVDRAHARVTEDFDSDPWLLNTPAGTIDLRTGVMHQHRRMDGLTKITPVAPSDGPAPHWATCLATWTRGDAALIAFLQRLCGYWLTGSVREEKLAIVYGPGANGKTKFIEAVRGCLGHDYAAGVAMETLIVTQSEQHPTDLADLRGKRLAVATETEEGRRLAEAKIKMLTGGDRIRARHMRQDFFEFAPTHKIVIVGNHRPALRNVDEAMRRRLVLIPFDVVIPLADRDPQLAAKLAEERPAILAWMLAGCRAWLDRGLDPPERVLVATEDYLASADAFARWVDECCVFDPNASVTKGRAFESWKAWAEAAGEFVGTARRLYERIARLPGVDETRLGKDRDRTFIGVGLR
jgi:putative DNA primase/helicase